MQLPINSSSFLPLTSKDLNFYLSQSKKKRASREYPFNQGQNGIMNSISLDQSRLSNVSIRNIENQDYGLNKLSKIPRQYDNLPENRASIQNKSPQVDSYNSYYRNGMVKSEVADSLDGLLTQRSQQKRQNHNYLSEPRKAYPGNKVSNVDSASDYENSLFLNNDPLVHSSSRQKFQSRFLTSKTSMPNLLSSEYKVISDELTRITNQLNRNSSKLKQMEKLYNYMAKGAPEQEIKRANLKYSKMQAQQQGFRRRPRVQYSKDNSVNQQYIVWQPNI